MHRKLEYNATLDAKIDMSEALALFRVVPDTAIPEGRWFTPGQYLTLGLNNEERPELGGVRRAMSIASAPQQRGTIDFYIRFVSKPKSDNPLTHLLWKMKAGDRLNMSTHAVGKFTIEDTIGAADERLKIFVSAGTGLAPFLSMIEAEVAADAKAELGDRVLLHGASYPNEIGFKERLEQLARDNGLRYFPTISRPKQAPEWTGHTGRVEDFFEPERMVELERSIGLDAGQLSPRRAVIFICGLAGTIATTVERLLNRGYVPFHPKIRRALEIRDRVPSTIFYEQYDHDPVSARRAPSAIPRANQPPTP